MIDAAFYVGDRGFSVEPVADLPPEPNEIRIDVSYCGICGTDLHAYHGHMDQRIGKHRINGHEMSGRVSAVGDNVTGFAEGDAVVVRPLDHCGGCPACSAGFEHVCHYSEVSRPGYGRRLSTIAVGSCPHGPHKSPEGLPLAQAALVEPLAVAAHDVTRAGVEVGEDGLVIGGGPIGMLVALAARQQGARVTITEINRQRFELARELGFHVLDTAEVDVCADMTSATGTKGCDVVFEVSGTQAGVDLMTAAAAARGRVCMVVIHASKPRIDLFALFWRELEMVGARVYERADFDRAIGWLATGIGAERLITGVRPSSEISDAFRELSEFPGSMKTLIRLN